MGLVGRSLISGYAMLGDTKGDSDDPIPNVMIRLSFNRVKLQASQYVSITSLCSFSASQEPLNFDGYLHIDQHDLKELIRANCIHEFLGYFPEWSTYCQPLLQVFQQLCEEINNTYGSMEGVREFREFAKQTNEYWFGRVMVAMRREVCNSPQEYFAVCSELDYKNFLRGKERKMKKIQNGVEWRKQAGLTQ